MNRFGRRVAGVLLVVDGAGAAVGVTAILPVLGTHAATAVLMVLLRALAGALELVGGLLLLQDREPGAAVGRTAAVLAAVAGTLGLGLRLAPSSVDPSLRLPTVVGYWAFAMAVLALTRRRSPARSSS